MQPCWYCATWAVAFLSSLRCTFASNSQTEREILDDDPLLLRVVQNTLKISRTPAVNVSNHASHRYATSLLRAFHESHIPTTIGYESIQTEQTPKTVVFLLDSCHEIVSLIFGSVLECESSVMQTDSSVVESRGFTIQSKSYKKSKRLLDRSMRSRITLNSSIVQWRSSVFEPKSLTIESNDSVTELERSNSELKNSFIEWHLVTEQQGLVMEPRNLIAESKSSTSESKNSVMEPRSKAIRSKRASRSERRNLSISDDKRARYSLISTLCST